MAVEKANISEKDSTSNEKITFTFSGVLLGAKRTIPVAISVFAVGIVFGVLARQAKLSIVDVLLMSGLVFAGASQFVATLPMDCYTLSGGNNNCNHLHHQYTSYAHGRIAAPVVCETILLEGLYNDLFYGR